MLTKQIVFLQSFFRRIVRAKYALVLLGIFALILSVLLIVIEKNTAERYLLAEITRAGRQLSATKNSLDVIQGEVIVGFKKDVPSARRAAVLAKHKFTKKTDIAGIDAIVADITLGGDMKAALAALESNPDVEFAEMNVIVPPALIPNDPWYANWEADKTQISTEGAWDISTQGPLVAIIDSGVDCSHPDLAGICVPGWNIVTNSADTADVFGHGTKVAGVFGAIGNNLIGATGVTWSSSIMPIVATDVTGATTYANIASSITYAADHQAKIANVSFQVSGSRAVRSAASYMKNKGGIVVVSAGNSGSATGASANTDLIVVSAVDLTDAIYTWSNYGNDIDLSSPGCTGATTYAGGGYGSFCGTSSAAPEVTGVLALIFGANPALSIDQAINILYGSAKDVGTAGWDQYYGHGRIDANKTIQSAISATGTSPIIKIPQGQKRK